MQIRKPLRITLLVLSLASLVLAPLASAEEQRTEGMYVGGGFAMAFEQFKNLDEFGLPSWVDIESIDHALGFDIWAGYRMGPHAAVEAQFSYLEGFDADIGGRAGSYQVDFAVDLELLSGTAHLKLYPFEGFLEPFVLGGVGVTRIEGDLGGDSEDDIYAIFLVGGGVDVYVFERTALVVGANYVFTSGDFDGAEVNPNMVTFKVGIQHRF